MLSDNLEEYRQDELIEENPGEKNDKNEILLKDKIKEDEINNNSIIRDKENNETTSLISEEDKKEKIGLLKIIDRLKKDLDSEKNQSLGQIYEQYLNNEDITKRNIKTGTTRTALIIMYYIISPIFSIINLIGVFESISMIKIIFQVIKNALVNYYIALMNEEEKITKFSINNFNEQYNFFNLFLEDTKMETFDFNLMLLSAFLGDILLKSRGFRISISVFAFLNFISIFLLLNFPFHDYEVPYNDYKTFQMLFLILSWLLLFIGVGASALLSQKIIIDSNNKYDDYRDKLNEESEKEWEKLKEEWGKKKQEREKQKEPEEKFKLIEIKEIKKEKKDRNNNNEENEIKRVNSATLSNYDKDDKNYQIKKTNTNELAFKNISKNIKNVQMIPLNFIKLTSKTLTHKDLQIDINEIEINSNKKIYEQKKNEEEKRKNKFNSFFTICITTIIGYFLKYVFNLIVVGKHEIEKRNKRNSIGCGQDNDCIEKIFNNSYLVINSTENHTKFLKDEISVDKRSFYYIMIIYAGSVFLSIILYSIFVSIFTKNEKKKNVNGNSYRVCEIFGYTIYSETIVLNINPPCCECCKLVCGTCQNFINMAIGSLFCWLNEEERNDINCFCCCSKNNIDFNKKNNEFFCYCYQAKRRQNWFNKFITSDIQKRIFPYMLEYFFYNF